MPKGVNMLHYRFSFPFGTNWISCQETLQGFSVMIVTFDQLWHALVASLSIRGQEDLLIITTKLKLFRQTVLFVTSGC